MKKGLLLDDERNAELCFARTGNQVYLQVDWDIVKTVKEFKDYIIKNGIPTYVSFDNDLCGAHYAELVDRGENFDFSKFDDTGYHAARWMLEYIEDNNLERPVCYIHTANPYAYNKILQLLSTSSWRHLQV